MDGSVGGHSDLDRQQIHQPFLQLQLCAFEVDEAQGVHALLGLARLEEVDVLG